ncbi:MAG: hypothetical protein ABI378_12100 [Chitinophagaceae bacterium]
MNLLLNASNLRHGGGRTVALQLISALAEQRPKDTLYVLAPKSIGYERLTNHSNIILLLLPNSYHYSWATKLWYMHQVFPKWCKLYKIDKVVSLGNAAFPSKRRPQLLYIQLPILAYHESSAWKTMPFKAFIRNSLMDTYVALHMKYASAYAMQTEVMRTRIIERFKLDPERVYLLPNAPLEPEIDKISPLPLPLKPLRLLFLSHYYPHKSFEMLPDLAKILKERNLPVQITLTLSERESPAAATVLQALRGCENIVNIGPVALKDVGEVVSSHHGIFLPSLMESFSGAYAEALLHRRLIFTSHYDFATVLLGDAAFYFDPLKPEHIASVFEEALNDKKLISNKLELIEAAAQKAPRVNEVGQLFSEIIDTFT